MTIEEFKGIEKLFDKFEGHFGYKYLLTNEEHKQIKIDIKNLKEDIKVLICKSEE